MSEEQNIDDDLQMENNCGEQPTVNNEALFHADTKQGGGSLPTEQESEISNNKLEIKNMEVHHHPHVEKKSFKEYLLEGLMIFLAVTMGFIAENIREKSSEHETEKKNIEIVVNNLRDDMTRLKNCIEQNNIKVKVLDSIISFKERIKLTKDSVNKLVRLIYKCGPNFDFISNDAAIEQMKSSGTIRLIKNKEVLDSILKYEYINKLITVNQKDCDQWNFTAHINHTKLDLSFYEYSGLVNLDQKRINAATPGQIYYQEQRVLAAQCFSEYDVVRYIIQNLMLPLLYQQSQNCSKLINLLQTEYHLKHE